MDRNWCVDFVFTLHTFIYHLYFCPKVRKWLLRVQYSFADYYNYYYGGNTQNPEASDSQEGLNAEAVEAADGSNAAGVSAPNETTAAAADVDNPTPDNGVEVTTEVCLL